VPDRLGLHPGVTWTPDSKSFYFTCGKDKGKRYCKLYYCDVAAKKSRLVVDFKGIRHWLAVSPDGKRVAVAVPFRDEKLGAKGI
jgi:Tol biopolymer transport system component